MRRSHSFFSLAHSFVGFALLLALPIALPYWAIVDWPRFRNYAKSFWPFAVMRPFRKAAPPTHFDSETGRVEWEHEEKKGRR